MNPDSVALYREFIEHASEVFYAVNIGENPLKSEVRFVSHQAEALTGHPAKAFTSQPDLWASLIHPADMDAIALATKEIVESGQPRTREYRIRHHPSGLYRWVEDRVVPIVDANGRVEGYHGVARDITDRRSQQHLAQTLASLGRSMRESESREDMIYRLLDALLTMVEANGAAFATYDTAANDVHFELGCGVLEDWTARRVKAVDAVSADVIKQGEPWISNDVDEDPRLAASRRGLPAEAKAYASIPMRHADGRVIGALAVSRSTSFADRDVQALMAVGEMAAVVLQRQILHAQLLQNTAILEETLEQTIEGWARALDMRDRSTGGHTSRVTELTLRLAQRLDVALEQMPHIRRGAMLHDIGKMVIPDSILRKPGPLTDEERTVMRRHVEHAYDILWPIEFLRPALEIPAFHHERWDGGGYPRGLKGEEIPLPARIFAVADVYDAITSDRPYAAAESRDAALAFISAHSGSHFDGRVVEALLTLSAAPLTG